MSKERKRETWPGDSADEPKRRYEKEKQEQEAAKRRRAPVPAKKQDTEDKE